MQRCASIALLLAVEASARVATAQSADSTTCHGSVERKAVIGRIVDDATGRPMVGVMPRLEALRRDTTYYGAGISVTSPFVQIATLDASGQFCFHDVPEGGYRLEARAMRIDASHQAIIIHMGEADSLTTVMLRYRPFGRSPEEALVVARMLGALDDNQRRWARSRPSRYLLRVRRGCGCLEGPPTTFEMLDSVAVATIDSSGVRHSLGRGQRGRTIESMFDVLRATLLDERQWVGAVEYDERFGFPRHYRTDTRTLMNDAWEEMTVERFDVIP